MSRVVAFVRRYAGTEFGRVTCLVGVNRCTNLGGVVFVEQAIDWVFHEIRITQVAVPVDVGMAHRFDLLVHALGRVVAQLAHGVAFQDDLERAVQSAKKGQKLWASMTAVERSRVLRKAVDILRQRNDELALLETLDTGKPLSETRYVDIVTGADVLEYYAGLSVWPRVLETSI